ncbi:uncharacterized protein TRIADDRAFT_62221 [Trichoplax adhaerens]|uniref:Structure-specific endonuclease subunit SLX4 n=1 Tax=Trichoplax adhaerens TaxID=10228 RepID=B3SD63_TRIAD|nr:hypothetical protein TRIADDRAFT_62221 [Trichoplax adhaerens]EDV19342.1 hypothetical protein TRIADDRAFT_62221 [Trichoplax adhaerens]|eukprot:XP_002118193.1 hypothetical protein TRIADDRAFT_62221 [Trichoplax adhaerens]
MASQDSQQDSSSQAKRKLKLRKSTTMASSHTTIQTNSAIHLTTTPTNHAAIQPNSIIHPTTTTPSSDTVIQPNSAIHPTTTPSSNIVIQPSSATTAPTVNPIQAVEASSSGRVCPVCLEMISLGQEDGMELFNLHVNQCLDHHRSSQMSSSGKKTADTCDADSIVAAQILQDEKENEEKSMQILSEFCPVCGRLLCNLSMEAKQRHVDQCCQSQTNKQEKPLAPAATKSIACPVCGKDLSRIKNHLIHIKRCGQAHGITTEQLIRCCQQKGFTDLGQNLNEPKAKPAKRKTLSKVDEETQLALAMSASMHDKSKREKDNTFALPGDLTSVGNKKRRKKGFKEMPQLLLCSEEEAKENIARNACRLLQENEENDIQLTQSMSSSKLSNLYTKPQESIPSPDKPKWTPEVSSTSTTTTTCPTSSIWSLSANLTPNKNVDNFYVNQLLPDQKSISQTSKSKLQSTHLKNEPSIPDVKNENNEPNAILTDIRSQLLQDFTLMLRNDNFCDVTIVTKDEEKVMAHACILAARSPYLYKEFHSYGNDCKYEVILNDFSAAVVKALLLYMYTGSVNFTSEILIDVAKLSKKLKLRHLCRYVKSLFDSSSNVIDNTKETTVNQEMNDNNSSQSIADEDISLDIIDLTQITPHKPVTTESTDSSCVGHLMEQSQRKESNSHLSQEEVLVVSSKSDHEDSIAISDDILVLSQDNLRKIADGSPQSMHENPAENSDDNEDFQFIDDGGYNADLDFFLLRDESPTVVEDPKADIDHFSASQDRNLEFETSLSATLTAKGSPHYPSSNTTNQRLVTDYSTPELKNQLQKYGVKPLPKRQMIAKLEQINQYLNDAATQSDKSDCDANSQNSASYGSCKSSLVADDDENSETDDILSTQEIRESNIADRISDFIKSNRAVYMSVLKYEPLELRDLHRLLKASSIKCPRQKLPAILDQLGVMFSMQRNTATGNKKDNNLSSKESEG